MSKRGKGFLVGQMKKLPNKKNDTVSNPDAELASPDWEHIPTAYWKHLQAIARDEGKRLWEARETWGAECKGFLDFMWASDKFFRDASQNSHDLKAASGLALSLASRISNVPPQLAEEIRKTARRLNTLADALTCYEFRVREVLGKEQDKALYAGKIPV